MLLLLVHPAELLIPHRLSFLLTYGGAFLVTFFLLHHYPCTEPRWSLCCPLFLVTITTTSTTIHALLHSCCVRAAVLGSSPPEDVVGCHLIAFRARIHYGRHGLMSPPLTSHHPSQSSSHPVIQPSAIQRVGPHRNAAIPPQSRRDSGAMFYERLNIPTVWKGRTWVSFLCMEITFRSLHG